MLVIVETVVPHQDKETVVSIVRQLLEAPDVITEMQKETVLTMVILVPMCGVSTKKKPLGQKSFVPQLDMLVYMSL
jgi:hypothetical protein